MRCGIKNCRENDGTLLADKLGVDSRVCRKWLGIIHTVAGDLAVWEQADIKYNGRRHDDESDDAINDSESGDLMEDESDESTSSLF